MDFVQEPYHYDYVVAIFKMPTAAETKWQIVFKPFKPIVWILVGLSILLVSVVICLVSHNSPVYGKDEHRELSTMQGALWYCFGATLTQGRPICV